MNLKLIQTNFVAATLPRRPLSDVAAPAAAPSRGTRRGR